MVRHYTATVRRGRIVVEKLPFADGTRLEVRLDDSLEYEQLTGNEPELDVPPAFAAELEAAMDECSRGETVSGEQVIAELRNGTLVDNVRRESEAAARQRRRVVGRKSPSSRARARGRGR